MPTQKLEQFYARLDTIEDDVERKVVEDILDQIKAFTTHMEAK